MPRSGGTAGQLIATENVQLGGYALSNDGDNEGIYIDNDGNARLINDKWLTVEKIKAIDSDGILIADDSGSNGIQVADGGALSLIGTASMSSDELTEGSTNLFLTTTERSKIHTQNTDTGTTSATFQLDSENTGPKLKNSGGVTQVRNAADDDFSSVQADDYLDADGNSIIGGGLEKTVVNVGTETNPSAETITTIAISENDSVAFLCTLNIHRTDGVLVAAIDFTGAAKRETAGSAELVGMPTKDTKIESTFVADADFVVSGNNLLLQLTATGEVTYKATTSYQSATGAANTSVDSTPDLAHAQNTDTGTTSPSFQLNSGSSGARLKDSSGVLQGRNAADDDFVNVQAKDFIDSAGNIINAEELPTVANDTDAIHDILIGASRLKMYNGSGYKYFATSAITKQIDANWVAGDDAGGFPSGLSLAADTGYYIFLIGKADGTVDAGFDTSATAANLLADATGYTYYRAIWWVSTDSSSNIIGFMQINEDTCFYSAVINDVADTTGTKNVNQTATISVPPNSIMHANMVAYTTGSVGVSMALNNLAVGYCDTIQVGNFCQSYVDNSSQLVYKLNCSGTYEAIYISTTGWRKKW